MTYGGASPQFDHKKGESLFSSSPFIPVALSVIFPTLPCPGLITLWLVCDTVLAKQDLSRSGRFRSYCRATCFLLHSIYRRLFFHFLNLFFISLSALLHSFFTILISLPSPQIALFPTFPSHSFICLLSAVTTCWQLRILPLLLFKIFSKKLSRIHNSYHFRCYLEHHPAISTYQ